MPDDWNFYFCQVNGVLASIALDLELRKNAPEQARPWLLWVWVYFKSPRPDGLSSSSEFESLTIIEDNLTETLSKRCDAVLCGKITTDGRREFYFYGPKPDQFELAVRNVKNGSPTYEFDHGSEEDPEWKQYLEVLYPSEDDFQRMSNRSVVEVLEKKGDTLKAPRDVRHWIYFRSNDDRQVFKNAIQVLEYRIQSETEETGKDYSFGLCIVRFQSVKLIEIDDAVIELCRLARKYCGTYDGWETAVIPQEGREPV